MAEETPLRDRIIDMFSIFEPNSQLPDEFRSCIRGNYINSNLSEHANLRGRYYSILTEVISTHVMQHPSLYGQLERAMPEDIPRLAAIEKQLQRDLSQPSRPEELEQSLLQRVRDIRRVTDDNPQNFKVNVYATGVSLLVMDSIIELDSANSNPVEQHGEALQMAVEQVVAQPEDVLGALLSSIQATIGKLHNAAFQQNSAAAFDQKQRLEEAIRFLPGGAGGRA